MNSSRLAISFSLLALVSACSMTKEDFMPWTANKKGNPQEQVILGERRTPGQQATQPYTAYSAAAAQPMPVAPQQNAGVMPPREMQQAPSQGWADQADVAPAPQKKGLFSFFSRKSEPEVAASAPAPDMGERRMPALNQQAIGGAQAAPVAAVSSSAPEEKPFPKLATVPDAPRPSVGSAAAQSNIKQMEQTRDAMAADSMPPPPPPPGAQGMMPPPPPPPAQAVNTGEKDYPVHRWADNPVPQTLEGGVITPQPAPMPAPIQPQAAAASSPTGEVKPQVSNSRWADADTSGQVQKVEVPTSAEVVGVPPAPTPAEPIVLAPRSAVVGDQIPESRYAARRRAE